MKVLLVNDCGTPHGGSDVNMLAIRSELRKRGHDARLFSSSIRPGSCALEADYVCFGTETRLRTFVQTLNPWAYFKLRKVLARFKPDVVHVCDFLLQLSPLILPLISRFPSIYHIVLSKAVCPMGHRLQPSGNVCADHAGMPCLSRCLPLHAWFTLMLQLRLWQYWRSSFSCLLTNSLAMKNALSVEGLETTDVIWNGFPRRDQAPLAPFPKIVYAGRLVPEKGVDVLLQAFSGVLRRVDEARLVIAGDGAERSRLEGLADRLGIASSVVFAGHVSQAEMERLFAGAWVQVVPSRCPESFGNVAAEAMMRGTVVVASHIGGLAEFIRHGVTGFHVPPDDVEDLSRTLSALVTDRVRVEQVGKAGRDFALSHLTIEQCVDSFLGVYDRVVRQQNEGVHRSR